MDLIDKIDKTQSSVVRLSYTSEKDVYLCLRAMP